MPSSFEGWAAEHGHGGVQMKDERGQPLQGHLLFRDGARAVEVPLGGWRTFDPPEPGTLEALRATRLYHQLEFEEVEKEFDKIKAMLCGTFIGMVRWDGPERPSEARLGELKAKAAPHKAKIRELDAAIEAHPATARLKAAAEARRLFEEAQEHARREEQRRLAAWQI